MWVIAVLIPFPFVFLGLLILNILRGQAPDFLASDFDTQSDNDYKSRLIELASCVNRKTGGSVNISIAKKNIKRHQDFLFDLLETAELPPTLIKHEFYRQKTVFWKYYFTSKNCLFPLLYAIVKRGEGCLNGKSLSYAVNIFNAEKPLTNREISCIRDMSGAILLWYIGEELGNRGQGVGSSGTTQLLNACISLFCLDNFWQPYNAEYTGKDFVPLADLRKNPRILALNQSIITDRGRDFCDILTNGESLFDTTGVSMSPYAFKYGKASGTIHSEVISTIDHTTNANLLLCTLSPSTIKDNSQIVEIEVRSNLNIYVKFNDAVHNLKETNNRFRVWLENSIAFELIILQTNLHNDDLFSFCGHRSLITASLSYNHDPIACQILEYVIYNNHYLAIEVSGNSGITRIKSLLPSFLVAKNFADFDLFFIFHEREDSLIDYKDQLTVLLKDFPSNFATLVNTADTTFDGDFFNFDTHNPIIRLLSTPNPTIIQDNSRFVFTFPYINTPSPALTLKLNDYSKISIEHIFESAPIYYGISGQLTAAFILPYISLTTLKEVIIFFCSLQERHGEIVGAYQNTSLLAGLTSLYVQISCDKEFMYNRVPYNDSSLGTILEHSLRSVEYCHYSNLTMPLSYEFFGKLLPYIQNQRTLKNCLNIIANASPYFDDPDYPGIVFHTFVEKTMGITKISVDNLRFSPNLPKIWKVCDITLNNILFQFMRQNTYLDTIHIEEDGRDLIKDTISTKGREGKVITIKY